jgi:hypothetical protein
MFKLINQNCNRELVKTIDICSQAAEYSNAIYHIQEPDHSALSSLDPDTYLYKTNKYTAIIIHKKLKPKVIWNKDNFILTTFEADNSRMFSLNFYIPGDENHYLTD